MKRQILTVGAFVRIPLKEKNYYTYARILREPTLAFYDIKTVDKTPDLSFLSKLPILCCLNVDSDAVRSGAWRKIGKIPLERNLSKGIKKYVWYEMTPSWFQMFNEEGNLVQSTYEECKDLDTGTLFGQGLIEDYLNDYYNGGDILKKKHIKGSLTYRISQL